MSQLEKLLRFISFSNEMRKVVRQIKLKGSRRKENDAEHSFQMALVAWYLISTQKFNLNLERVLMMCLAHDLVEVYAGDTFFYADSKIIDGKADREMAALKKIETEFPEFPSLILIIEDYEKLGCAESEFVMALDKILPILDIYLDGGRVWHEHHVTFDKLVSLKKDKVAISPEIKPYFDELVTLLEQNPQMFGANR